MTGRGQSDDARVLAICWLPGRPPKVTNYADRGALARLRFFRKRIACRPVPLSPRGDRAVLLKRRRLARDDFWGVKGNLHSHQPGTVGDRTLERCLVQPFARLTPVCRRIRRHPFAERQAATGREKNWKFSPRPGCALLTLETIKPPYRPGRPRQPVNGTEKAISHR